MPGIGPIISSAMVAAIGTGDVFSKGRDFAAWLGLVPKQMSTGDRTILGKISKRGNRYLRKLFVQAAWVVLVKPQSWERHGLKSWIEAAKKRLHHNVLAIALANKLARITWAVLAKGRNFEVVRGRPMRRPTCLSLAPCSVSSRPRPGRRAASSQRAASLDQPSARRRDEAHGRDEGKASSVEQGNGMRRPTMPVVQQPKLTRRGLREETKRWRSVFPARSNTGDPNSPSRLVR